MKISCRNRRHLWQIVRNNTGIFADVQIICNFNLSRRVGAASPGQIPGESSQKVKLVPWLRPRSRVKRIRQAIELLGLHLLDWRGGRSMLTSLDLRLHIKTQRARIHLARGCQREHPRLWVWPSRCVVALQACQDPPPARLISSICRGSRIHSATKRNRRPDRLTSKSWASRHT